VTVVRALIPAGLLAGLIIPNVARATNLPQQTERASKKELAMTKPVDDAHDFTFTFRSDMDPLSPGIFEHMEVTRVDGRTGHALMLLNRPGSDLVGVPVGLFGTTLSRKQTAHLAATVDAIKWAALPKPQGGDVSSSTLSIDYGRGGHVVQRAFNASNGDIMELLEPLIAQMTELSATLEAAPQRAVALTVERTSAGFKLILKNIGKGKVMLADARQAGATPGTTRGTVSVAEKLAEKPGTFEVEATFIPVALRPLGGVAAQVVLGPGERHEVETVVWTAPHPGTYFVRATWEDYVGPEVDAKSVLPMIPDPAQLSDARPYVVRGAAFSEALMFTVGSGGR
jgi:hypothetical protein